MPEPRTADELLDLVQKSGLVDNSRLSAYLVLLRAAGTVAPEEPSKLAERLVRDGIVTTFQAEQLMMGKWRRFSIGKYTVLERLGSGSAASVFLCEHKPTHWRVAVKVLPTVAADDPASLERFYREARALASLDHPNIVRGYDIDQEDKLHFLVMEYVDGSSLQDIVEKFGPMAVPRVAHYLRQAALGLQHAHESAGIVHRDLKPADVLLDRGGCVKIIDMGYARFTGGAAVVLPAGHCGIIPRNPDYTAPEQAVDPHIVDIRADIYGLGATFYFCLTGRTPLPGSIAQKLTWLQTRQPDPIRQLRPEVPEGMAVLIERMMAKHPAQRPQTPREIADALAPYTAEPVGPPPEHEMPRLSPAASGDQPPATGIVPGP